MCDGKYYARRKHIILSDYMYTLLIEKNGYGDYSYVSIG